MNPCNVLLTWSSDFSWKNLPWLHFWQRRLVGNSWQSILIDGGRLPQYPAKIFDNSETSTGTAITLLLEGPSGRHVFMLWEARLPDRFCLFDPLRIYKSSQSLFCVRSSSFLTNILATFPQNFVFGDKEPPQLPDREAPLWSPAACNTIRSGALQSQRVRGKGPGPNPASPQI